MTGEIHSKHPGIHQALKYSIHMQTDEHYNQVHFIYIAQNHKSQCFLYRQKKNIPKTKPLTQKIKLEKPLKRDTEKGSLSQERQTCNRCCVYRTDHQNNRIYGLK